MATRMTRGERSERNRLALLEAAGRVFRDRGYVGATLEGIADAAGFTKGAIYSQFRSKADLFCALLEARIGERAQENAELIAGLTGDEAVARLLDHVSGQSRADPDWGMALIEFRVQAARDPKLNRRYAELHGRTIGALSDLFESAYEPAGAEPPLPPRHLAELVLAIGTGAQLEHAVSPEALGGDLVAEVLAQALTWSRARAASA
jgi:AcrR family transcriptional regulator